MFYILSPRWHSPSPLSTNGHVYRVWVLGDAPRGSCPNGRNFDAKRWMQILRTKCRLRFTYTLGFRHNNLFREIWHTDCTMPKTRLIMGLGPRWLHFGSRTLLIPSLGLRSCDWYIEMRHIVYAMGILSLRGIHPTITYVYFGSVTCWHSIEDSIDMWL